MLESHLLFDPEEYESKDKHPKFDPDAKLYECPKCKRYCQHQIKDHKHDRRFTVHCYECGYHYSESQRRSNV